MTINLKKPTSKFLITLAFSCISIMDHTSITNQIVLAKSIKQQKCDVLAYITETDLQGLNVRSGASTKNRILGQVPINETVRVIATARNWVKITNASGGFKGTGWVSIQKLGISTRGYATNSVNLYASSNQQSRKIRQIPANTTVNLLDCKEDWAQIEYQGVKGWLAREDQCGAALTTCS